MIQHNSELRYIMAEMEAADAADTVDKTTSTKIIDSPMDGSDSRESVSSANDLNESIFTKSRESTERELMELVQEKKPVNKTLKSSKNWAIIAGAISEKQSLLQTSHNNYIGWDGLKTEKESDRGKVGRIQIDQREELNTLRSMKVVQRMLQEDKDISQKTSKLFPLPSPQRSRNLIVPNSSRTRRRERLKKSVREKSQAIIDTVFSVPSKRRRVLDRLTAQQLESIGKAEVKRSHQISSHYGVKESETRPLNDKLRLNKKKMIDSEDDFSDNDTLNHLSERDFGSTSTLAAEIPRKSKSKISTPSPLLLKHDSSLEEVGGEKTDVVTKNTIQNRVQVVGYYNRTLSTETSSSSCYSSRSSTYSTGGFSTQSTQSSFEWESIGEGGGGNGGIEEKEEEEERSSEEEKMIHVACQEVSAMKIIQSSSIQETSSLLSDSENLESEFLKTEAHHVMSTNLQSTTQRVSNSQNKLLLNSQNSQTLSSDSQTSIHIDYTSPSDSESSPVREKPRRPSESWSWLESAHFINNNDPSSENSYKLFRQSITSPAISDTPLDLLDNHPLSACSNNINPSSNELPESFFEDLQFVEFCKHLDHEPTKEDYATYRILIVSELIEEKYGKKLEAALHEIMIIALKDKLGYNDFTRVSRKLALHGKYFQERMLLITCLGRSLFEKMPNLEEMISNYTTYAIEEMALVGLDWAGDTPFHNPEIRWDYDNWECSDRREALEENSVPYTVNSEYTNNVLITPSSELKRSNSAEVLNEKLATISEQSPPMETLTPPMMNLLLRRRCSWGNAYTPPPQYEQSINQTDYSSSNGNTTVDTQNDSIMRVTTSEEVSHHLGTFRNCPTASKPIVFSLSTQSSVDSVTSSIRSIRTIRGSDLSSLSSSTSGGGRTSSTSTDKGGGVYDEYSDPFADCIQPIFEEEESEREDRESGKEDERERGEEEEANTQEEIVTEIITKRKLIKLKELDNKSEELDKEENGQNVPTRKTSTQMLSEAITSPVITVGLPMAVAVALALGKP